MISIVPCPFCGSTYAYKIEAAKGGFRLQCPGCDAQTGIGTTDEVLRSYWERRPSMPRSEDSLYIWNLEQGLKNEREKTKGLNRANWFWQLMFSISFILNVAVLIGAAWS